jgi:hypothetical protein
LMQLLGAGLWNVDDESLLHTAIIHQIIRVYTREV